MRLHYQSYGQGEPLIILHGLLGSLGNWQSISLKLAGHFRVLAVDQRNHGCSPHSSKMDYQVMAQDVAELLQAERLEQVCLLGHSMGGKTAMTFALEYPARARKLIVVDIAPRAYRPRHEQLFQGMLALRPETAQTRRELEQALAPWVPELTVRQFLLKNLTRDPAGGWRWKIGLREIHAAYPKLNAALTHERPYEGPALFLRGESSDYISEEDPVSIRRLFPAAQLRTIPGANHLVHTENPGGFLHAVLEFLR